MLNDEREVNDTLMIIVAALFYVLEFISFIIFCIYSPFLLIFPLPWEMGRYSRIASESIVRVEDSFGRFSV